MRYSLTRIIKTRNISKDTSATLSRAKLNKYSGDVGSSKDKSGLESFLELRRSWYVEGHTRFEVISFRPRAAVSKGQSDKGTVLAKDHYPWNDMYLTVVPKGGRQQYQRGKGTPRRLTYDFDREAPERSLAKKNLDRFSLESFGTSDTRVRTRSVGKSQKSHYSKGKEASHLRRSKRLEGRSKAKEGTGKEKSHAIRKRHELRQTSLESEYEEATKQEELPMPVWCKMFCQTLGGAARNWLDDLDPKSVDSFEELSQKFLEEFLQQKRYAKDPTEIHGIKRRQNEGLQAFMDLFKFKSSHIKGVLSVLRISAFMHGHGHPELAKKLNDKILKTVDEMFERVRAFIRGELAAGSTEIVWLSQGDKGNARPVWSGGQEKSRNRSGPRDTRRNIRMYTL
ncbi:reverse transcriptase domain-containing protein, partial [Tanacetum coccineum]